jgi:hypothetical protein
VRLSLTERAESQEKHWRMMGDKPCVKAVGPRGIPMQMNNLHTDKRQDPKISSE